MNADRGAFKAVLWKEFRENLKWAVLGSLFVSIGVFLFFRRLLGDSSYGGRLNWADVAHTPSWATPLLTPVVALMIGIAQVILENRGDSWGFLTHRPMQRSALFWGKAAAGMTLYFAAVGLPLLCASAWAAIPGHLPMPMDARMALPLIADILCGLVYYFAALLTGMREARWYASRVMCIGIGIACSYAVSVVPEFWQAVVCCAIGILIASSSAWGTFVQGGRFESQSPVMRFTTALCVCSGLLITGIVVVDVAGSFVSATSPASRITRHTITGDGDIVQAVYDGDEIVEVRDLQGSPIERYKDTEARGALGRGVASSQMIIPDPHIPWNGDYRNTTRFFRPFESGDQLSNGETVAWYYITRLGLFEAYQNRSRKLIGWMGPGGFTAGTEMPKDRFESQLVGNVRPYMTLITFENAVYRLDLWRRRIYKVFAADTGESVVGASDSNMDISSQTEDFGGKARFVAISTTKRVVIQSRDGATQMSVPRDERVRNFGGVIVYRSLRTPEAQTFIWYTNGFGAPAIVMQYGSAIAPAAQYSLPNLLPYVTVTWEYIFAPQSLMQNLAIRTLLWNRSIFYFSRTQHSPGLLLAWWLIPFLEGLLFAALVFARARRYAFSSRRLGLWTAIGFLLGPLGYALMLSLLEWPAFENCPDCGRSRLVTRPNCEHCSKPFPPPDFDGTEVFEPIPLN
jgi:hypothetical protein